ncbi:MAG TPA: phosphoribosylformylglycinamidine synthase subunit PurL [Candidatus Methylacidiphilales bacterium]|nr:phosphoribosylformylglycinamidine synthase subunit PurL [Candidatus Methylacidiphilales bacterium]
MPDPAITPELIAKHGLAPEEYQRIQDILGRKPNFTELGIFSVMWSEHCSYKNSRLELRKFPTTGPGVLVKAGEENAGVIDIGDGWGIAFKMESHNHPSAVEPFQGAATGVGGILRDIFTMGARPVFLLNSLRFGDIRPGAPHAAVNRRLFSGVVSGIAHYGNCIGVPTVGGEIYFDASYDGNPLVNVFCLGTLKTTDIRRGAATGPGNPVFYVGARTGRDGLAGAAFASRDLTEDSKADRPAVQVGDPFIEKLLLEACLELFQHPEAVVGVQDMGAAGLTCSTCETASRGSSGIEIDLALVPQREPGMTPYEIMLSESQERMLIIVRQGHEKTVTDIFTKWDLPCARIGHVTADGLMRVKNHGVTVAEIPAKKLADEAPLYKREGRRPADLNRRQKLDLAKLPEAEIASLLPKLLATPDLASKRWVYRQYDHMVRLGTVTPPGSDAAVVRIPTGNNTWKYLGASVDCNAHYVALEPKLGALIAVAECARNLAMTGAEPLALTDNLNFGNPHNPENFYQLQQAVDGLAEGCRAFGIPVTGGNVSLYNQSPAGAIDPTPTVGIVGLIRDPKHITPSHFQNPGDAILLIGGPADGSIGEELGASLYLREAHDLKRGRPPELNLEREKKLHEAVRAGIRLGEIRSAHDLAEGGLLVALAECAIGGANRLGATVTLDFSYQRLDALLFGESQSRALVTTRPENAAALAALLNLRGVPARRIGTTGGDKLIVRIAGATAREFSWDVAALHQVWEGALDVYLG